jgi:MFS family permease
MFAFTIVWLGQIVSVLASAMSQFGLTIWMYDQTKSALAMGMMQVFFITPFLLISPIAGVMVDRHNRKMMMMVSDVAAGIATMLILVFMALGLLEFWHMYFASVIYGLGMAFQWPAYSAAISTMVPKEQLGRANGMMSLIEAGPGVFAPILAGALLPIFKLTGLLFFDVATFLLAIGALMFVHIPQPPRTEEGQKAQGSIWREAAYGFQYIFKRPSLLGLQLIFFAGNLFSGIAFTVLAPMILARTDSNSLMFGSVQTAGAIGGLVGGVIMSSWGGFKKRTHGVLGGWIWSGLTFAIVGLAGGLPVWITGVALGALVGPLVNGSNQAIWQSKSCLFRATFNRLAHESDLSHHRGRPRRLSARTRRDCRDGPAWRAFLAGWDWPRRGHGTLDLHLRNRRRGRWVGRLFQPRDSQCRNAPA